MELTNLTYIPERGRAERHPAIILRDVGRRFDARGPVLEDVNLTLNRGDFMAVTGPNGGGKTTLLRIILKLLKPTCGSVEYIPVDGTRPLRIGYLPQKSAVDSRFPITVEEVVALGLMGRGAPTDRREARISEMIERLELKEKTKTPIGMLSGGQLQRALIGRAMIAEPDVIVLDEPLSYLDKRFERRLYEMLAETRAARPETAIVLVSHEMSEIASMATRHIIVDRKIHVCRSASHLVHYDCEEN